MGLRRFTYRFIFCFAIACLCSRSFPALHADVNRTERIGNYEVVANQVIFRLKVAPNASVLNEIKTLTSASVLKPVGGAGAYVLTSRTMSAAALTAALSKRSDVKY